MITAERVRTTLRVTVTYPPAAEPFKDDEADRAETVGQLKQRVLTAFELAEGSLPDGTVVSYHLYHQRTELANPNQTLGEIAGEQRALHLKLAQQLTQGQ